MFYTPKHCNECGEKIDRSEWKLTTNRRFCEVCESEFKVQTWFPFLILAFGLLGTLIGIGSLLKKDDRQLNVSTTPIVSVASNKNQNVQNSPISANANVQTSAPNQIAATDNAGLSNKEAPIVALNQKSVQAKTGLPANRQNAASETIYFCGAQTKKGTPCSRRVKGGGRCWQHQGQPAMLPPEKLIAGR